MHHLLISQIDVGQSEKEVNFLEKSIIFMKSCCLVGGFRPAVVSLMIRSIKGLTCYLQTTDNVKPVSVEEI